MPKPNILFIMTDQQRYDAIRAHGNPHVYTPNMDRLAARGISFSRGYSTCPVCVPARATIRTGREPFNTGIYKNMGPDIVPGQPERMEDRCGPYLARTMQRLGYRTFGMGKFHTSPWDEDLGYEVHLHSEEIYGSAEQRSRDAYAAFIAREHPHYDFIEDLMGERTSMYYMPQMSAVPAAVGVESWAADRAIEQITSADKRPYFGFVSWVGPHPPLAPPLPFNRMYDPDKMPNPIRGNVAVDHRDDQIPWMNYAIWAEDVSDGLARVLKARYYGEISYIDHCLGRILDAMETRGDAENTLICFYSDHGDHLGDHHGWQKESFFEAACHVPFLVSWPERIAPEQRRDDLVCLTDLFGIATSAADAPEFRDGVNVLGSIEGSAQPRERLVGYHGVPGTPEFKIMVRTPDWKYIYFANGGQEQLFNVTEDPLELQERSSTATPVRDACGEAARHAVMRTNVDRALDGEELKQFPFERRPLRRIYQFAPARGVRGFPEKPEDALQDLV